MHHPRARRSKRKSIAEERFDRVPILTHAFALRIVAMAATITLSCTYSTTEVLVALDTDAPISRPLSIRATVRRSSAMPSGGTEQSWTRGGSDGGIQLPGTFAVVPSPNSGTGPITLVLDAQLDAIAP